MSGHYIRTAIVAASAVVLSAAGCSTLGADDPTVREGTQLPVTNYGEALPSSRQGYAGLATFMTAGGGIHVLDPGTGPADPPRLLRSFLLEKHSRWDAQLDDDGYLWVATPDGTDVGSLDVTYVIDPHTGEIHRRIQLPDNLRAVAALAIGPEEVYLRAWRNGFSGGIGAVSRACVTEARDCDVRFLKDLGNVGTTPERGLRYDPNGSLYSFNQRNSRDERASTLRLDPATGSVRASFSTSGDTRFEDGTSLFMSSVWSEGPRDGARLLRRLNKETLAQIDSLDVESVLGWIAIEGDSLYAVSLAQRQIEVYSTTPLARVRVFSFGSADKPTAVFGFVAPGVLMLNEQAWLNTQTGAITTGALPLRSQFSQALRHGQGHPLAF